MPVFISSTKEGFRRCGIPHSKAPTEWPDDRFSEDELKRLMAEPKLSVTIVPVESAPEESIPEESAEEAGETSIQEASAPVEEEVSIENSDADAVDPENDTAVAETVVDDEAETLAQDVLEAARQVVAAGDTIKSGAPDIKAMEKILGRDVDADERNLAWEAIQAETEG